MNTLKRIQTLIPNAQFAITGDDYNSITWFDERPKPSLEELEAVVELAPQDWNLLVQKLLNSQVYMKAYYLSKTSLPIAQAFNKVEQVLLITKNEAALEFFLNDLLGEIKTYITAEELAEVNQALHDSGFNITIN